MGMSVWDESQGERRSEQPRRGRIRRFADWKDFALFLTEVSGGVVIGGGLIVGILTSMGFKVSGSGEAITKILAADVARDTAIAQIRRQNQSVSSRLDAVTYLVCMKAKRDDRTLILPRECNRVIADQEQP